ncbi:triphosphoribosyl-dephospho-CoA synthase [Candidatus Bathyarchaeota archaeon]|nr:triphosphoribosyl-dephospho-CoA synthase [Candidatus Bathyarchaeota archaeon]MBS7629032.1 triphosphoribosyl-dephospho-CoA synthase [Candidatus Bathyarchaeota archaeon]
MRKVEEYVSGSIQLAILLEVSAYPKPGNVHRTANFERTRYEHFLASAVGVGHTLRVAASKGRLLSEGRVRLGDLHIGRLIKDGVSSMLNWQHGGNTILGTLILTIPISIAAGYVWSRRLPDTSKLRKTLSEITHSTTSVDSVEVCDAIRMSRAGGLGSVDRFDVTTDSGRREILDSEIPLIELFHLSSSYDSIASEWVNDFKITFEVGYPYFIRRLEETGDYNIATVDTFLKILSTFPDTLIARKAGEEVAREISCSAGEILSLGGLESSTGRRKLYELDVKLRLSGNRLNPGATADLTASSLAIALLQGFRP